MIVVVAEKPSVARDIAAVLEARSRGEGHFYGGDYIVTWGIGHLVALAEPHEMNAAWKRWRLADLPMLPSDWPLVVVEGTRSQYEIVRKLIVRRDVREIVCATDAGREGELIFRYIYEAAKSKKPVRRLWISSLTPAAIAEGFRGLKDGRAFDRLADAARARSRADWLVGMNLSRVYSVLHDSNFSVGRVQTPTLAMIVARELEIRAFVPEDYLEVVTMFDPGASATEASRVYEGTYVRPLASASTEAEREHRHRLPIDGEEAAAIVARARAGQAKIASVDRQVRRLPPPQLYDLTELQRHANRLYGFTAQRTLQIAQTLYEQKKILSYPRTDSRFLSRAVATTLPAIVRAIEAPYLAQLAPGTGAKPLGSRFVDDARVSDHHAILPTETPAPKDLPPDERKIYDLVCRRLLQAWHGDHVYALTSVTTEIVTPEPPTLDRYTSTGTSVEDAGWKVLDVQLGAPRRAAAGAHANERALPGGLRKGDPCRVSDAKAVKKTTRPKPRLTDGTLLTAMETAGRTLDEKELSAAMRDRGLGTPATRAAILETLLRREYIVRDGKSLAATDKGIALIELVHPHVKSPAMTGEWEAELVRMERGQTDLASFTRAIEAYVREVVGLAIQSTPPPSASRSAAARPAAADAPSARVAARPISALSSEAPVHARSVSVETPRVPRPERSGDLPTLLRTAFGFPSFRPYQEDVCRAAAGGRDVLLVMPTGAGKSLCYQLPGLARLGTTLVISPLIALMEDQVAQLVRRGFEAERIHSGRDRAASRAVCRAYLDGALDFLFIAPERLKVPGFPEMLARRKPTLVAIDEAHCISQWGHDFRPDYRMLGERLPLLRPAPIIALTATATPAVQDDIVSELRLTEPARFIHGFRRTNIAVEVVERNPSDRGAVVARILAQPERRPAIVYAPTRNESEKLTKILDGPFRAAAYHAGLGAGVRERVQTAFLAGRLDVIVATTAFGMGIDKADVRTVVHAALPASVEGYYQEIGRAGRDGGPSRAILLQSFVDTKTHEFFLENDYPTAEVLATLQKATPADGWADVTEVRRRARVPQEIFDKALEKLWVHGGVLVDAEERVKRGTSPWREAYERQRAHKKEQLAKIRRYAEASSCRMLALVRHFGDERDGGASCGMCDVCDPKSSIAHVFRAPSSTERIAASRILAALAERDGRTVGQIHREVFEGEEVDRKLLDHILGALTRAGEVVTVAEEFEKDGVMVPFSRVFLARSGAERRALMFLEQPPPSAAGRRSRGGAKKSAKRGRKSATSKTSPSKRGRAGGDGAGSSASRSLLENELRSWRTAEARRRRVPPFRILTDQTLIGLAISQPRDLDGLVAVRGMGDALASRHGAALLALIARHRGAG